MPAREPEAGRAADPLGSGRFGAPVPRRHGPAQRPPRQASAPCRHRPPEGHRRRFGAYRLQTGECPVFSAPRYHPLTICRPVTHQAAPETSPETGSIWWPARLTWSSSVCSLIRFKEPVWRVQNNTAAVNVNICNMFPFERQHHCRPLWWANLDQFTRPKIMQANHRP